MLPSTAQGGGNVGGGLINSSIYENTATSFSSRSELVLVKISRTKTRRTTKTTKHTYINVFRCVRGKISWPPRFRAAQAARALAANRIAACFRTTKRRVESLQAAARAVAAKRVAARLGATERTFSLALAAPAQQQAFAFVPLCPTAWILLVCLVATVGAFDAIKRSHPTQAAIRLDFDYSDAVGLPSSPESRSFVRACPLQWLPVLMAVVGMPPPSPPTSPPLPSPPPRSLPSPPSSPPSPPPAQPTTAFGFSSATSLGWSNGGGDLPYAFTRTNGGTPSSGTGPSSGVDGTGTYLYADSSSDLISTLGNNSAVSRIILKAGTYEFDDDMCSNEGGSALCIDRNVTIEAEVAGSVVLNAKGARRVIYVAAAGRAELVGLNITGGEAAWEADVSYLASIQPSSIAPLN